MTREEKLMKVHALLAEVSDVLVDRFFDADSEELLDEKIEVLTSGIETDLKINKPVYAIHLGKQLNIVDWYKEQNKCVK